MRAVKMKITENIIYSQNLALKLSISNPQKLYQIFICFKLN